MVIERGCTAGRPTKAAADKAAISSTHQPLRSRFTLLSATCVMPARRDQKLRQRIKPAEWLRPSRLVPQTGQLLLVQLGLFDDQPHGARWQVDRQERQTVDCESRLVLGVFGMKVRRCMIGKVHLDDDAVEAADLRHPRARTASSERSTS